MSMVVSHWSANALVLAVGGAVAVTHLLGLPGTLAEAKRLGPPRPVAAVMQAVMFYCGLLAIMIALVSPVAYWSEKYIWVRSQQDVLLALAAPGLIVLGAPWLTLRRGAARLRLPRPAFRRPGGPDLAKSRARQGQPASPGEADRPWKSWPVVVTVVFNAFWIGWHLPGPYDAGLRHAAVRAAEVVSYLGLGTVFWLQMIGSRPLTPRLPPLSRAMLVIGSFAAISVLAMVLVFANGVLYPAYLGSAHHVLSVVADENIGGAVLWTGALLPFGIAAVALCIRWVGTADSEAMNAGLDRLLGPSAPAWPSRPGLK